MTNRAEAVRCLHVIKSLLTSGLPPSAIGVICLYRAQAELLGIMLSGEGGSGGGASKRDAGVGMSYGGVPMASPTKDVCGWDSTGDVAHGAPHGRVCQDEEMREVTVSTVDAFQVRSHRFERCSSPLSCIPVSCRTYRADDRRTCLPSQSHLPSGRLLAPRKARSLLLLPLLSIHRKTNFPAHRVPVHPIVLPHCIPPTLGRGTRSHHRLDMPHPVAGLRRLATPPQRHPHPRSPTPSHRRLRPRLNVGPALGHNPRRSRKHTGGMHKG